MDTRTFVVIGVSQDPEKYGRRIFRDMVRAGWKVYGIHPNGGQADGRALYRSLAELPETPDIAVLVIPPEAALAVLPEVKAKGISQVWFQPGAHSPEAITAAQRLGLAATHDACIMVKTGLW